ncbi:MAG: amidohydrolase family protein [Candidatus Syntrophosphaera sp.]|nr:amidohydrolase family protein [Candidatus Syntrophosphaera sp.]
MAAAKKIDVLIRGGTILCLDEALSTLEDHDIAISGGRILEIVPSDSALYEAAKAIDATDCIVMPGLINAHTHLPMTYFRGLADDLPLMTWLKDYIWPLEARLLDREFIRSASLHGASEMIKNGITQIHDMYFDLGAIAEACTQAGLRGIIGEAVIDSDNGSAPPPGSKVLELRQRYKGNPLVDFNLAPHSIYACSRDTLLKCAQAASDLGVFLHMHLSETEHEVRDCQREHGKRPVFYLKEIGILELPAIYAHGVWVDAEEIELLAEHPASIAICSESNLKLASGILPLKGYLDAGVNVCFATDGVASNNNLDLLAEMDVTAKLHKAVNNDPSFLPAARVLQMATLDAAKALGVGDRRGSLETGKDADICILTLAALECQPLYNPYSHVIYTLGSRHVRDVMIAGELVLEGGRLTRVDEAELISVAKTYRAKILRELKK